MTEEATDFAKVFDLIVGLRKQGYAIIVWTPSELEGVDPDLVETMSTSYGFEVIDMNKTEDSDQ
jgi:hypothetical protein